MRRAFAFWLLSAVLASAQQAPFTGRGYLYLEPGTARFECLFSLPGMMAWLGLPAAETLTAEARREVSDAAAARTSGWLRLKLDGVEPAAAVFRAMIVKGVPGRTELLPVEDTVASGEAMLGLIWEYDLAAVPEKVEFTWSGFSRTFPMLVVSVVTGPATPSEDSELHAASPSHVWENRGRLAARAPLAAVPPLPPARMIRLPLGSLLWVLFCLVLLAAQLRRRRKGRKIPGRVLMTLASLLLGATVLWRVAPVKVPLPWRAIAPVPPDQAELILAPLLRNVYRAFDQRDEQAIYDVLARSIEGELLQKIYLQIVSSLTLDALDSTRVRLDESAGLQNPAVHVETARMKRGTRGFVAATEWTVIGNVGHWGHQHRRINRYTAKVAVEAVRTPAGPSGASFEWKIVGLEVERETRM